MERRNTWLPLTIVALLAGGALAPHLGPGSSPSPPGRTTDTSPRDAKAGAKAAGSAGFVNELAQLLNVDIGEVALVRQARERADGSPRFDDAEMIRCFFDLDVDRDKEFDDAARDVTRQWPRCGGDFTNLATPLPEERLVRVRRVLEQAVALDRARIRETEDASVARALERVAASQGSPERSLRRSILDDRAAAARRRMAFLAVRRAAGWYFRGVSPDAPCADPAQEREFVQFVIATVPDPVDSYARWQFDPMLMTLLAAATADGYLPTRFNFPDTTSPPAAGGESPLHERTPGVVLLRHDDRADGRETHKLLVLLLAYETATAGVHQAALASALRIVLDWDRGDADTCAASPGSPAVLLLAPTFSGSSESVAAVLDSIRGELGSRKVRIVSGSANSAENFRVLNRPPSITFRATVYPNKVLLDVLWDYLSNTVDPALTRAHSVAWLAESNTAYGNSFVAGLPGDKASVDHIIRFFPLHLSRIRAGEPASAPQASVPARFGPLQIEDRTRYTDQLPLASDETTRSYVELTLDHTLRSIRDARVGVVGLFATDARDKLFLARQVLAKTPNVILFTTESDILYSHPDFYSSTEGMLIAAPYPLNASNSLINRDHGEYRRELPESTMMGVFNALTMLLNYDADGRPTTWRAPGLLRYGNDTCSSECRPDVWISIVGRSGVRPVWRVTPTLKYDDPQLGNALNNYIQPVRPFKTASAVRLEPEPRVTVSDGVRLVFVLATLPMLALGFVVAFRKPRALEPAIVESAPYLLVACLALVPIALLIAAFAVMCFLEPAIDIRSKYFMAAAAGTAAVLLLWGAVRAARSLKGRAREHWVPLALSGALVEMAIVLLVFLIGQRQYATLFVERLSQPLDGTSPGVAVAALALSICAWPGVECFRLWRRLPIGSSEISYLKDLLGADATTAASLQLGTLNAPMLSFARPMACLTVSIAALTMALLVAPVFRPLIAVDGRALGEYLTMGIAIVQLMIVVAIAQFVCSWQCVSRLLDHVAALGLNESFRELPDKLFPNGAIPRMPRVLELESAVHLWQRLAGVRGRLDQHGTLRAAFETDLLANPRQILSHSNTWPILLGHSAAAAKETRAEHAGRRAAHPVMSVVPIGPAADPVSLVVGAPLDKFLAAESDRRASETERNERSQFAAIPLVLLVRMVVARMWDNLAFVAAAVGLTAATLWAYHLQMKDALISLVWCDVIAAVVVVLYVFVDMERNELLSHITSTKPGEIAWNRGDFAIKLLVYGLIPLAGLFATQFPNLSGTVMRWLEPVQKALP
jgi:hypothetical protein